VGELQRREARLVLCSVDPAVRKLLDAYGLTEQIGAQYIFGTLQELVDAYPGAITGPTPTPAPTPETGPQPA